MGKRSTPNPTPDPETAAILAAVASQSKPVNHPGARYPIAQQARDAQANGVGRRLAKTVKR
ncbi:hypothetical protein ABT336_12075 [Micromonospora sp. NPDC000207]|uniref:hypothetical protein n=1 Tax=Micromonospora sp. NPDC000207 TaxID=3154246 RepID=UPI0033225F12